MEFKNFTYLLLLLGSIAIPLVFTTNKEVNFHKKIKYLLPAIIFSGAIFIMWDIRFEEVGIWKFNRQYILGKYIYNLPIEEWLFFLIIPYCCVFIYEVLKTKLTKFEKPNLFLTISLIFLAGFILTALLAKEKLYTFFTFFLLSIYFGYTIFRNKFKQHLTKFFLTWCISLIPLLIFDGILTALPVVEYNSAHIIKLYIYTIPIEDFFYFFLLLLMNLTIYEYLKKQKFY